VLALIGNGRPAAHIADELTISANTLRAHLEHLRVKLGACSTAQLVIAARNAGLVPPAPGGAGPDQ
jgi:DNA-binding CsgD family transcriptional regulator